MDRCCQIGSRAAAAVLSLAANVPLRAWAAVQRARLKPEMEYRVVERDAFTSVPEIDAKGAEPRAHFLRCPAILNWKRDFARLDTSVRPRAFHVVDDAGRDVACFLLRIATHDRVGQKQYRGMRICRVLVMLVPPSGEEARAALRALLQIAASERADVVELLTSDDRLGTLCRSIGLGRFGNDSVHCGHAVVP